VCMYVGGNGRVYVYMYVCMFKSTDKSTDKWDILMGRKRQIKVKMSLWCRVLGSE
jgi:hypothetical protein